MSNCSRRDFVVSLIVAGGAMAVAPKLAMGDDQPAAPTQAAPGDIYWATIGPVASFADGVWTLSKYPPEFGHKKAFVKVTGGTAVVALSPKCPHQGCVVSFDAAAKQFNCPCHAGKFDSSGAVISGPPTSPLPTLQAKIDGGNVVVQSLTPPKPAA